MDTLLLAIRMLQMVLTNFCINIGPALASDIPKSNSDNDFTQYLSNMNNMDSLYIEPVSEEEIIQLVNNAKSKTSKGHDDLDMCLVKKIIPYVVTPLKHIFNTSLQKGIFPDTVVPATSGHLRFGAKVAPRGRWPLAAGNGNS